MNLKELNKELPYKEKPGKGGSGKLKYIDARQVMDLLDEVCEPQNWQCEYYELKGVLFCKIGISIKPEDGIKTWVWKSDCGTESAFDPEKGEASDAFKRAAVKWGIGRFLYKEEPARASSMRVGDSKFEGTTTISSAISNDKCDKCSKDMVLRNGKNGEFWACTGYPACKNTKTV